MFVDMFERFIPANQVLVDTVSDHRYGQLEQLTTWNWTAPLWPGASLGLHVLPLEAMHSDMDIITHTLGLRDRIAVSTVARDDDGYTATFTEGVLHTASTMGYDGKPSGTLTVYTPDGVCEIELPPADQYADMIDHILDALHGRAENVVSPASVIDALRLTRDLQQHVAAAR